MFFRGQTIGKYRIVSALGSGGFGSVYLAEDTWIDKKVALKVPHKQGLDFSELLKEPRLLASMSHPNIVTVLTAEKQDDVFFIVMLGPIGLPEIVIVLLVLGIPLVVILALSKASDRRRGR